MAYRGLGADILGHISLRVDDERALVRCRGPIEAGLRFTEPSDIRLVELSTGELLEPEGDYRTPSELPIHTELLIARSDVASVVHVHPPDVVVAGLAGLPLVALVGAFNIPAMRLAAEGIPRYERSVLIRTNALGCEVATILGDRSAIVLHAHGLVTVGATAAAAMLNAMHVDTLARLTQQVRALGVEATAIAQADQDELPDLGAGFNEATLWRHHLRALAADGWDL